MRISDLSSDVCSSDLPPAAYWAAVNSAECWRWQRLSLAIAAIFMHRKKRASPLRSRPNGPAPAMTTSQHSAPSLRKWPSSLTSLKIRSEEHTSELQSLMRTSYAVFCLKKKKQQNSYHT